MLATLGNVEDDSVGWAGRYSWALPSVPQERSAALKAIRRFLEQHPATRDGTFDLPMQILLRTTRRS